MTTSPGTTIPRLAGASAVEVVAAPAGGSARPPWTYGFSTMLMPIARRAGPLPPPAVVGHRGWLGVRLDRAIHWDELAGIVEDAYAEVAPPKLADAARRS